jgi:hypothetical protein
MLFPRLRGAFARFGFLAEIGVACVFAAIGPSHAVDLHAKPKPAPKCDGATYEQAIKTGRTIVVSHPSAVFHDHNDDEAAKLIAAINAMPPATEYLAEHILNVETPDDDPVRVALVHDGCMAQAFEAGHTAWSNLRRGAIGDPS